MSKDTDFIKKMKEIIIPSVEELVRKEEEHLEHLRKSRRRMIDRKMMLSLSMVDRFIKTSEQMLGHFRQRLQEYKDYAA